MQHAGGYAGIVAAELSPAVTTEHPEGPILCVSTSPTMQRTLVFDRVVAGDTNRAREVYDYASGKGINAARVLHTLGHPTCFLGLLGGERGAGLKRDLEAAGIPFEAVDVEATTRLCMTVVDAASRQATELIEESAPVTRHDSDALLERLQAALPGAAVLVLSGSLAVGVPDDFYAQGIRLARSAGVPTVLDARGEPLRRALVEQPTVVKPNRPELAATVGQPVESRNTMRKAMAVMIDQGARYVVVTRGRDGSSVCDAESAWEVSTPRVQPISPIGSGDAFAAGLAVGMKAGTGLPEACRLASACGAANAKTLRAGFLDPARVVELMAEVSIREID